MYDLPLRGMNTFPNYAADNRQFKKMRTLTGAFFLPSYINCTSYIVPSYIFLAIFRFLFAYMQKKVYLCTAFYAHMCDVYICAQYIKG